jgi:hypothetical protein
MGLKRSGDALFWKTPKGKLTQVKKLSPASVKQLEMIKGKKLNFGGLK